MSFKIPNELPRSPDESGRGIRSVIPACPESFFKNDSGQAGMTLES